MCGGSGHRGGERTSVCPPDPPNCSLAPGKCESADTSRYLVKQGAAQPPLFPPPGSGGQRPSHTFASVLGLQGEAGPPHSCRTTGHLGTWTWDSSRLAGVWGECLWALSLDDRLSRCPHCGLLCRERLPCLSWGTVGPGWTREGSFLWVCPRRQPCGAESLGLLGCMGQLVQPGVPSSPGRAIASHGLPGPAGGLCWEQNRGELICTEVPTVPGSQRPSVPRSPPWCPQPPWCPPAPLSAPQPPSVTPSPMMLCTGCRGYGLGAGVLSKLMPIPVSRDIGHPGASCLRVIGHGGFSSRRDP